MLPRLQTLTPSGTYGLYLCFIIIGLVLAFWAYPETKGLSVDEAFSLFEDDFGVKKSKQMRKEKEGMQREMRQEGALVNEYQVVEIVKEHGAVHLENLSVGPKI